MSGMDWEHWEQEQAHWLAATGGKVKSGFLQLWPPPPVHHLLHQPFDDFSGVVVFLLPRFKSISRQV